MWPRVEQLLAPALARCGGRYDAASVKRLLNSDKMHLWVAFHGKDIHCAGITSVVDYPAMRVIVLNFIGGFDRADWIGLIHDVLVDFGKKVGAKKIEFMGRRGWTRDAREFRYTETTHLFEHSIED